MNKHALFIRPVEDVDKSVSLRDVVLILVVTVVIETSTETVYHLNTLQIIISNNLTILLQ